MGQGVGHTIRPLVIVVDDFDDGRELMVELLELSGFDTAQARDGVEALELMSTLEPDLMVLDLALPRLDGFQVAARVRCNPLREGVPIVAVTGHAMRDVLERAIAAGCDRALCKPCDPDVLLDNVRELLQLRRLRSQVV
jgi:two-component system, cell cycle response regulator DivK